MKGRKYEPYREQIHDVPKELTPQSVEISNDPCGNNGNYMWPNNYGCTGKATVQLLHTGFMLDRFGSDKGTFFGNVNDYFIARSIPYFGVSYDENSKIPSCRKEMKQNYYDFYQRNPNQYNMYTVKKPFFIYKCSIGPAFGFPGGGTQYWSIKTVEALLKSGNIEKVEATHIPFFDEDDYDEHKHYNEPASKASGISLNTINTRLPGGKKRRTIYNRTRQRKRKYVHSKHKSKRTNRSSK